MDATSELTDLQVNEFLGMGVKGAYNDRLMRLTKSRAGVSHRYFDEAVGFVEKLGPGGIGHASFFAQAHINVLHKIGRETFVVYDKNGDIGLGCYTPPFGKETYVLKLTTPEFERKIEQMHPGNLREQYRQHQAILGALDKVVY